MSLQSVIQDYIGLQREAKKFVDFELRRKGPLQEVFDKYVDSWGKNEEFFRSFEESYFEIKKEQEKIIGRLKRISGATGVSFQLGEESSYLGFLWDLRNNVFPIRQVERNLDKIRYAMSIEDQHPRSLDLIEEPVLVREDLEELREKIRIDYSSGSFDGWRVKLVEDKERKGETFLEVILGDLSPRKRVMLLRISPEMVSYLTTSPSNPRVLESLESILEIGKRYKKNAFSRTIDRIREHF